LLLLIPDFPILTRYSSLHARNEAFAERCGTPAALSSSTGENLHHCRLLIR
jgi:hypothetical protein